MTQKETKIDLSARRNPIAGTAIVAEKEYEVRKFTGHQYQKMRTFDDATPVAELYDLVAQVVPSLSEEDRLNLDREQVAAIITLASQGIDAVERLYPNVISPAT